MKFEERSERIIWHFLTPVFPFMQNLMLSLHIVKHNGRQPFLIGKLIEGKTMEELKDYLSSKYGFGNHFIAWKDAGQVFSWRKRVNFNEQYHLRGFEDGELRGHFEETPEAHPIDHMLEHGETDRRDDFLQFLKGWIVPASSAAVTADFEKYKKDHC